MVTESQAEVVRSPALTTVAGMVVYRPPEWYGRRRRRCRRFKKETTFNKHYCGLSLFGEVAVASYRLLTQTRYILHHPKCCILERI